MYTEREAINHILKNAVVADSEGTLKIGDSIITNNLNGKRAIGFFLEGIENDFKELGQEGADKLYRGIFKNPERLGRALSSTIRLLGELDADVVAGR